MDPAVGVFSKVAGPPNDDFVDAVTVPGAGGSFTGSNVGGSHESGEPSHAGNDGEASVWWRWTAPASGLVMIDLSGSDFDTMLGVYTGPSVDALTEVTSDDHCGTAPTSMVSFPATGGTVYHIAVDGFFDQDAYETAQGSITGVVALPGAAPTPANDDFGNAVTLPDEGAVLDGTNCFATHEAGEPRSGDSVWWRWIAPANGTVDVGLQGSDFDTFLAMYTGDAVDALWLSASNDDEDPRYAAEAYSVLVNVAVYGGTTYHVAVDGAMHPGTPDTWYAPTNGRIRGDFVYSPPSQPNDFFLDAEVIPDAGGPFTGHNAGASAEPGEPDHAGSAGGISVWWRWTAPGDGLVTIDLEGSDRDAMLAVYTGGAVDALTEVAWNYDAWAEVTFPVAAGVVYHIAVDEFWDCNSLECSYPPRGVAIAGKLVFQDTTCNGWPATITGTEGHDVIDGTAGDDVIVGFGGNDKINGKGGNDIICGNAGDDDLLGGPGNDVAFGGDGADHIFGGTGNDTLKGDTGNDVLDGAAGRDLLLGGAGDDALRGRAGEDRLFGENGNDRLKGGEDDDVLYGGHGDDIVNGQAGTDLGFGQKGADRLIGFSGNDDLRGGADNDRILGGGGWDALEGGSGDDVILGGGGDDLLDGNSGIDELRGQAGNDACLNGELLVGCE
jgi:hypothetical protein